MELEAAGAAIVDGDTEDVRRQQVAGELHALERQAEDACQHVGQGGFADPRNILDEQMPMGHEAGNGEPDLAVLAQYHVAGSGDNAGELCAKRRCGRPRRRQTECAHEQPPEVLQKRVRHAPTSGEGAGVDQVTLQVALAVDASSTSRTRPAMPSGT
jgi:hypothetical protein